MPLRRPFRLCPLLLLAFAGAHCGPHSSSGAPETGDAAAQDAAQLEPSDAAAPAPHAGGSMDAGAPSDAAAADVDGGSDAGMSASGASDGGANTRPDRTLVYVGGYSDSDPLRVFEIDRQTLALKPIARVSDAGPQASYITPSANGSTLYVANESSAAPGISVLHVDGDSGVPVRIDHESAIDQPYVHSALSPDGKYLLAASYNGGNLGVYPVNADGTLEARVTAQNFGAGAQSHCALVHPSGWVYVPNKGLDSIAQLRLDASGKLTPNTPDAFPAKDARANFDGPRHIAFSPDLKRAFVILELGDALISLAVQSDGTLSELDRKPRLPAGTAKGDDTGAHVLVHPTKSVVYGSNRGTNTLVTFAYDAQGKLRLIGHTPSRGRTPRDFALDPRGEFLIVANQDDDNVAVFAIEDDGSLTAKGNVVSGLSAPAAVAIVAR